jgi:hypothetical protein
MKRPFLITLFSFFIISVSATHLRTGEIRVRQDATDYLSVWVTVVVYTNSINTSVLFGGEDDWLDFGDGTRVLIPETQNTMRPDLGEGVATASYTIKHTYLAQGKYLISYSEPNRNEGILNMDGSVNTRFFIETLISVRPGKQYKTPGIAMAPIFHTGFQESLTVSLGGVDSTGYTLRYKSVSPKRERNSTVINYKFPGNFSIDPYTGLMTWDTKFMEQYLQGEYAFAVKVIQLDTNRDTVGYMFRDFQIILHDQDAASDLQVSGLNADEHGRTFIPESGKAKIKITATAAAIEEIGVTVVSELLHLPNGTTLNSYDSAANGALYKVVKLDITHLPALTRDQPYAVSMRFTFKSATRPFTRDATFLFYTKEIDAEPPPPPPIVVDVEEPGYDRDIEVYPNPFSSVLFVAPRSQEPAEILILDQNGRRILKGRSASEIINTGALSDGLYFVLVYQGGKATLVKVVKR